MHVMKKLFVGNRCGNVYTIDIDCASTHDKCFSALHDDGIRAILTEEVVSLEMPNN